MLTRLFALAALIVLTVAQASAAPVTLPDDALARLENGERVRVIVWFSGPEVAEARPEGQGVDPDTALIDSLRDTAILRSLGIPADILAAAPPETDGPRIAREFLYTPAAAMVLSRAEIEALAADPNVRRIEIDELSRANLDVSVPLIGATALHNGGQTGAGTSVAILDTGVDLQHPMFAGRIAGSACFSSTSGTRSASFCPAGAQSDTTSAQAGDNCEELANDAVNGGTGCSHGTHVAGIAVGGSFTDPANGARTLRGVAPGAGLVAVQVFSQFLQSSDCGNEPTPCVRSYSSDQTAALEWLYTNRAALNLASINMSLGGGRSTSACPSHAHNTVINQLRAAGVATAIASGNNGYRDSINSPGCIPAAITVGSSTKTDGLSSFSNSNPLVDVLAPGSSIRSAIPSPNDSGVGGAATFNGTSMATPHVAGAIALLRSIHPTASIDAIESALEATGLPIASTSNNVTSPRIRVDQASAQITANNGGALGNLTVTPFQAFNSAGNPGDDSSFASQNYTLTNNGGTTLNWTVSSDASWLRFTDLGASGDGPDIAADQASGSIAPGGNTVVRVSVNSAGLAGGGLHSTFAFSVTGTVGSITLAASVGVSAPPSANDNFASAFPLSSVATTTSYNSVGASKEVNEPNHAGNGGGASLWWSWTAPVSGTARIRTQNADYDTMLAVYTGTTVSGLTSVAANDDIGGGNLESQVEIAVTAGTIYRIAVDGYGGAAGTGQLAISMINAPANDAVASAQVIAGTTGSVTGSNVNATKVGGEPSHGGDAGGASVWYSWTAPSAGPVTFDATASSFAALVGVYTSPDGGVTLTPVASGNGVPASFAATSGTTYLVAVDGVASAQGVVALSWALGTADNHRLRAAVLPNARSVSVGQTATAFATLINPASFGAAGSNCRIERPGNFNGGFTYRTTDPATNQPTGTADTAVSIPSGGTQSFVFGLTPGTELNGVVLAPVFRCDNVLAATSVAGVTTMTLSAAPVPTADVVTIAATATGNGVATAPLNAATAFSVASVNIGAAETVTVTPGFGGTALPLTLEICETNPANGQCTSGRAASATVSFANNETRTFSVFVRGTGQAVAFVPGTNRVFVTFTNGSSVSVGATSVAVQTAP